jgi:hypothetical protein
MDLNVFKLVARIATRTDVTSDKGAYNQGALDPDNRMNPGKIVDLTVA